MQVRYNIYIYISWQTLDMSDSDDFVQEQRSIRSRSEDGKLSKRNKTRKREETTPPRRQRQRRASEIPGIHGKSQETSKNPGKFRDIFLVYHKNCSMFKSARNIQGPKIHFHTKQPKETTAK